METDQALVARCREGRDERAFAELVRRYRDRVFRLAVSILGPGFAPDAEEVTQEVFLRVFHALRSYRGEAQFGSWVYRIAFNQALNVKARARFRATHVSERALADRSSAERDPLGRLEAARRDRLLAACIGELPEVYQSSLRLHYWMGASIAEIATLIGVPENTVKSYLHRSRRMLHAMLKERGFAGCLNKKQWTGCSAVCWRPSSRRLSRRRSTSGWLSGFGHVAQADPAASC